MVLNECVTSERREVTKQFSPCLPACVLITISNICRTYKSLWQTHAILQSWVVPWKKHHAAYIQTCPSSGHTLHNTSAADISNQTLSFRDKCFCEKSYAAYIQNCLPPGTPCTPSLLTSHTLRQQQITTRRCLAELSGTLKEASHSLHTIMYFFGTHPSQHLCYVEVWEIAQATNRIRLIWIYLFTANSSIQWC